MRNSSLSIVLLSALLTGGCQRPNPPVAMLPDTPTAQRPETDSAVVFGHDQTPTANSAQEPSQSVQALQEMVEEQDRLFGVPPSLDRGSRAGTRPPLWTPPPPTTAPAAEPPAKQMAMRSPRRSFDKPPARPSQTPPAPSPASVRPAEPPEEPRRQDPIPPSPTKPPEPEKPGTAPQDPEYGNVAQNPGTSTATTDGDVLRRDLLKRVKDHPTDAAAHLNLQMFFFLREEAVPQIEMLTPLPKEQREIIVTLMNGLVNFRHMTQTDPNALPSRIVGPLLKMSDLLREQTEMSIPTMQLCQSIVGLGTYEPRSLTFQAGQIHKTYIYCEVENFSSRLNDKGLWETRLTMETVLYDSNGDAVHKGKDVVEPDLCRQRRRDFYVVKELHLPATLAPSRYILKVTIVDEQVKRIAENSLQIMMMANNPLSSPAPGR